MDVFENILSRGYISWDAIEILLELTCFNYKMLSSLIVLYCLSSIPHEVGGLTRLIKDSFIIIPLIS